MNYRDDEGEARLRNLEERVTALETRTPAHVLSLPPVPKPSYPVAVRVGAGSAAFALACSVVQERYLIALPWSFGVGALVYALLVAFYKLIRVADPTDPSSRFNWDAE